MMISIQANFASWSDNVTVFAAYGHKFLGGKTKIKSKEGTPLRFNGCTDAYHAQVSSR